MLGVLYPQTKPYARIVSSESQGMHSWRKAHVRSIMEKVLLIGETSLDMRWIERKILHLIDVFGDL